MNEQPVPHGGGELISTEQAARRSGLSVSTLNTMRCTGRGPAYFKIGRYVRYDSNDLAAWLRSRRFTSTSQESAA